MDIHNAARPPLEGKPLAVERAPGQQTEAPAPPAAGSPLSTPATTQHLTVSTLLLDFLQLLESKVPAEAKGLLAEVAQQLRAAGASNWAERFQRAADSGELTSWVPSAPTPAHFGVRAYQAAAPAEVDLAGLDAVLGEALASATNHAAAAANRAASEADGGVSSAQDPLALEAALARRPDLFTRDATLRRVARRSKRRHARRSRSQRRWRRGSAPPS